MFNMFSTSKVRSTSKQLQSDPAQTTNGRERLAVETANNYETLAQNTTCPNEPSTPSSSSGENTPQQSYADALRKPLSNKLARNKNQASPPYLSRLKSVATHTTGMSGSQI